jgi:hypothetical protein
LFHRNVGRLGAAQDLHRNSRPLTVHVGKAWAAGDEVKRASVIWLRQVGGDSVLKSLMASKSLFGHHLLSKSLNVLACVPSPGPTTQFTIWGEFLSRLRKAPNWRVLVRLFDL